jgi:hypothetical protein
MPIINALDTLDDVAQHPLGNVGPNAPAAPDADEPAGRPGPADAVRPRLRGSRIGPAGGSERDDGGRLGVGLGRDGLYSDRGQPVHCREGPPAARSASGCRIACRRRSRGCGSERGRARDLPLHDALRHRVRPHRQLLRLHRLHVRVTGRDRSAVVTASEQLRPDLNGKVFAALRRAEVLAVCAARAGR